MTLIDRYPGIQGCRLDTNEDDGQTGPAVDLNVSLARASGASDPITAGPKFGLWVRESGTGNGKSAKVELSADNVRSLRDGCTLLLIAAGLDEEVTITVTVPRGTDR